MSGIFVENVANQIVAMDSNEIGDDYVRNEPILVVLVDPNGDEY